MIFPMSAILSVNVAGEFRHFRRHVTEREKFLRVNFTVPDKLVVDVAEDTPTNFDACLCENPRLKCQVGNVNILQCRWWF